MRHVCVLLVCVWAGCVYRRAEYVMTGTPRPAHHQPVPLHADDAPNPITSFEEIAIVYAVGQHISVAKLSKALADQARAVGANAIIHVQIERGGDYSGMTGVAVLVESRR